MMAIARGQKCWLIDPIHPSYSLTAINLIYVLTKFERFTLEISYISNRYFKK